MNTKTWNPAEANRKHPIYDEKNLIGNEYARKMAIWMA
jgi:hypothetical protein